ncbi:hypothetical protein [Nocardia sp. NPDC060249]|uniref:hypothetical protein n=1 Tax=Nocardia sp. NPDC060249 TaxID=3347082 RepID=UPI00364EB33A
MADLGEAAIRRDHAADHELLSADIPWPNRAALQGVLTAALVWRDQDELAAPRVEEISTHLANSWGVIIDADDLTADIDPNFDPMPLQDFDDAACLLARETAVLEIVAAAPMPDDTRTTVLDALEEWRGAGIDPADPRAHILDRPTRDAQLYTRLTTAALPPDVRKNVEFTIAYLSNDVSALDLLETPVMVDPRVEARGRMRGLLHKFAEGRMPAEWMTEEVAVLSPADQEIVRDIGRAIKTRRPVDLSSLWADHPDRESLKSKIESYALDLGHMAEEANYIAEEPLAPENYRSLGVDDDIEVRFERMAQTHDELVAELDTAGLTRIEHAQLKAVVDDLDAGQILSQDDLPELLWVDERTKAEVDERRTSDLGAEVCYTMRREAHDRVHDSDKTIDVSSKTSSQAEKALQALGNTLYDVATSAIESPKALAQRRERYAKERDSLTKILDQGGVGKDVQAVVEGVVHAYATEAGRLGRRNTERGRQWKSRGSDTVADEISGVIEACRAHAPAAAARGHSSALPPPGGMTELSVEAEQSLAIGD